MNAHQKDMRLVDDLDQSDEVRSLLRAGIDDDVAGYDFNAGLAAHMATIAALPPAGQGAQVPQPVAAAAGISGKALIAWIGVPVASATVLAALWFGGSSEAPKQAAPQLTPLVTKVAKTLPVLGPRPVADKVEVAAAVAVETTVEPSVSPGVEATRSVRAHAARPQRNAAIRLREPKAGVSFGSSTTVSSASSTGWATDTASQVQPVEAAPTAAEREALAKQAAAEAAREQAVREEARRVAEERLKREMAQLMQAKQALTSNPARALFLAQAGEQEFHDSLFSEERQHVLLLALIKLGRVDEAERRAQPFLRAHPDSPFARRVRNALQDAK